MWPLLLLALSACVAKGAGIDLPYFDVVYQCEVEDVTIGNTIVDLELCFDQGADELEARLWSHYGGFAICNPTQRHAGPCVYCCGPACGRGANALNGCWCSS